MIDGNELRARHGSALTLALILALGACGGSGEYAADPDDAPPSGPQRGYQEGEESVFGEGGFTLDRLVSGNVLGSGSPGESEGIPVNRFLWQASLDTLNFLPLDSTDPFTGVIATGWGSNPGQPDERFKVAVYMVRPALAASSLKVAVYRERRGPDGAWGSASVDPDTPRQIEDAILLRARQIRIAEIEGASAS